MNLRENQLDTHYSTEEQVVGEWVDGKPVYQKTFLNVAFNTTVLTNVDTLVDWKALRRYDGGTSIYVISDGNYVGNMIILKLNNHNVSIERVSSSYSAGNLIHLTIQYTKTTD